MTVTYVTDESGNYLITESGQYVVLGGITADEPSITISNTGERLVYDANGHPMSSLVARVGEDVITTLILKSAGVAVDTTANTVTWKAVNTADATKTLSGTATGGTASVDVLLSIASDAAVGWYQMWVQVDGTTWPTSIRSDAISLLIREDV